MRASLTALILALALSACASDPADDPSVSEAGMSENTPAPASDDASTAGDFVAPSERLNLNTATAAQLKAAIPDFSDRMAGEFEEYRPWSSVGQFRREIGKYINDDQPALDRYLRYVYVPIDRNTSDAETMAQLPGLSQAEAQQLVDGQPYASDDEFLTAYESISGEPDAEAARMYLAQ